MLDMGGPEPGIEDIRSYYSDFAPTAANIIFYLLTFYKPPRWLFDRLLRKVEAFATPQRRYPVIAFIFRLIYLMKRGFALLRFMDFSVIVGRGGYIAWRLGIINMWGRCFNPRSKTCKPLE